MNLIMLIAIAAAVTVAAVLAVHTGLTQAVSEVFTRVCECYKCASFWATLLTLALISGDVLATVILATFAAYSSHWIAAALATLNDKYERLWQQRKHKNK